MPALAMPNLFSSDGANQQAALGSTYEWQGTQWTYIQANSTTPAYTPLIAPATNIGYLLTATAAGTTYLVANIVVPQFAMAASDYGWAISGPCNLTLTTPASSNPTSALILAASGVTGQSTTAALTYTNTTSNSVSQTSSSNTLINSMILTSSNSSGSVATVSFFATADMRVGG